MPQMNRTTQDQALDIILKAQRLEKTEEGNVFRIGETADLTFSNGSSA